MPLKCLRPIGDVAKSCDATIILNKIDRQVDRDYDFKNARTK